jgi:predicted transcriptional regulator
MIHRGEIVEQAVRNSGLAITKIAQKLGKSRRWMYLMFDNPKVDYETILKIGTIINYDFSDEIKYMPMMVTDSPKTAYEKTDNTVDYWKEKYFKLLEEHHELLKKLK